MSSIHTMKIRQDCDWPTIKAITWSDRPWSNWFTFWTVIDMTGRFLYCFIAYKATIVATMGYQVLEFGACHIHCNRPHNRYMYMLIIPYSWSTVFSGISNPVVQIPFLLIRIPSREFCEGISRWNIVRHIPGWWKDVTVLEEATCKKEETN